jgi:hypothetical protein
MTLLEIGSALEAMLLEPSPSCGLRHDSDHRGRIYRSSVRADRRSNKQRAHKKVASPHHILCSGEVVSFC